MGSVFRSAKGGWAACSFSRSLRVLVSLLALAPSPVSAQIQRTLGVHIGLVQARQIWSGSISTEALDGLTVGVNVDVPTPASFLSIRAGAGYVQRGSLVQDEAANPGGDDFAKVRSHYLSLPLQGKLSLRLGSGSIYVLLGPSLDLLLSTSCTEGFCSVLENDRPSVLNVMAGCGLALDVGERFRAEFEVWATEGLTDAYQPAVSGVQYRSLEFLVRAAFPF